MLFSASHDPSELSPERLKKTGRLEAEHLRPTAASESSKQPAQSVPSNTGEDNHHVIRSFKDLGGKDEFEISLDKPLMTTVAADEVIQDSEVDRIVRDLRKEFMSADADPTVDFPNTFSFKDKPSSTFAHEESGVRPGDLTTVNKSAAPPTDPLDLEFARLFKHQPPSSGVIDDPLGISPEEPCEYELSFRERSEKESPNSPMHKPLVVGDLFEEARRTMESSFAASYAARKDIDVLRDLEDRLTKVEIEKRAALTKIRILESELERMRLERAKAEKRGQKEYSTAVAQTDMAVAQTVSVGTKPPTTSALDTLERLSKWLKRYKQL